ncbi:uncharacterized protein LOC119675004 [Teleopsis dalmanni]|uniref:uncharacterized protein LOC119675004 n=1 Tax=Teleopsis dalmanni TaxID=139649 RepID=UPI0018CCBBC5|nr:uncharacterized protein LOC119675004 [Teleopsis dalmanni]
MRTRRNSLPTYAQSCETSKSLLCQSVFATPLKDPLLIIITLTAVVGSFCLLSGLTLLCLFSRAINDEISETILLIGIGFFITSLACVSWHLTNKRRISEIIEAMKDEIV